MKTLKRSEKPDQKCQPPNNEINKIRLPCSNLKHRERFAASISGVGWSRTRLHHCRGLSDFSWGAWVLVGKTYNLNQNTEVSARYTIPQSLLLWADFPISSLIIYSIQSTARGYLIERNICWNKRVDISFLPSLLRKRGGKISTLQVWHVQTKFK